MSQLLRVVFFIGDLLFLNLAVYWSYSLTQDFIESERVNMTYLLIFSNLSWLFLIIISNPYSFSRGWGTRKFMRNQISYLVVHLFVVAFLIFFFKKAYAPIQVGFMYLIFVPADMGLLSEMAS